MEKNIPRFKEVEGVENWEMVRLKL